MTAHIRVFRVVMVCVIAAFCTLFIHVDSAQADDWSAFDDTPSITSSIALIADGDGNILFSRNSDEITAMASITKLMTAIVALESGYPLDTMCTVSENALDLTWESSVVGYKVGDVVSLNDLLHGLLVHSGNDAAVIIAEAIGGTEENFVDMMNAKAQELGMYDTHFANPHGLDAEGHYTTANDLLILARYAMSFPLIASIVGTSSIDLMVDGTIETYNTTDLLIGIYPGIRGIKTGYTANAGRAFVGLATRGGQSIYVIQIGADSEEQRWIDVNEMLDWAFSHYPEQSLDTPDIASSASISYADHFGWTVTATLPSASLRISPFVTSESDPELTIVMPALSIGATSDHIGLIIWTLDGSIIAARSLDTSSQIEVETGLGSTGSFYGLDRF